MFEILKKLVSARFTALQKYRKMLVVDYDRDAIWSAYLDNFSEETRQEHNCNCCKSFIRQVGGVVAIDPETLKVQTLWGLDMEQVPVEFQKSVAALHFHISSLPIKGLFMHPEPSAGVDKNRDKVRNVVWQHFHVKIPQALHDKGGKLAELSGALRTTKEVFKRALDEITPEAISMVLEAIAQGTVYRGPEYVAQVGNLKTWQEKYREVPAAGRDNFCWLAACEMTPAFATVRNSVIGTLLVDLSEGRDFDSALASFESKNAPANYKRPKSAVTPRMIEAAKKRLEELGMVSALERRRLDTRDLSAAHALFTFRPTKRAGSGDVFDKLKGDVPVDTKTLSKVEEVSIEDFVKKVLPTAKSLKVLLENRHLKNLATLTGPADSEAANLFKWDNSFGWSYTGGVGDSLRDQVAALGGRVDGVLRFSHSWNHDGKNQSLMDLHVFFPPYNHMQSSGKEVHDRYPDTRRVGWNHRSDKASGGNQDVDFVNEPGTKVPVENITFPDLSKLPAGTYTMKIHNWNARHPNKSGFRAEIEFGGQVFEYDRREPLDNKEWVTLAEVTLKKGEFTIKHLMESSSADVWKWGLKTNTWHAVRAVTLSPNHWTKPEGNKHFFFLLEGCVSDEKTVPFLNEFLCQELAKERKVTEALVGAIEVAPAEGAELSGLGFSETMRNHIHVEVEGAFKRVVKVNF